MKLRVIGVEFYYNSTPALEDIVFEAVEGELTSIIGPNGAGKTTLLKVMARLLKPKKGVVYVAGKNLWSISSRESARIIAYSSTSISEGFNTRVLDYLLTARYPHTRMFALTERDDDIRIVEDALSKLGISHLVDRRLDQLSSGELQRVLIARLLVQQPRVLLIDEPTAHLDLRYQLETMELLREITLKEKLVTIITTHNLWIAARYSDKTILLGNGKIIAQGEPENVITPKNIMETYRVKIDVYRHPRLGLIVVPISPM